MRREKVKLIRKLAGVDLFSEATTIEDNQFRKLRNFYPPRGSVRILAKRLGSAKYNAAAITGATRIDNGIRAHKSDGTKKLIVAINKAGADELHVGDDVAGTFAQITGGSALPSGKKWFFLNWPLLGKVYAACGDGTVPIQVSSNFTTKADLAAPAGIPDARFGQFLQLFFTRIVTARTPTNPAHVYYFDTAAETITNASQFWRHVEAVTALGKNTYGTTAQSLREMLLVFGAHSMGFVAGPPNLDQVVTLEQASNVIGCKSPKTVVNTPIGCMFLGSDRMVYLVRSDPREPEKVGLAIRPELQLIPESQLIDACAVYHDGFYKLAFSPSAGTTNTIQYWADLDPVLVGEPRIDWYGPHDGLALLCFILEDGPDDALTLKGGDDTAGTVWKLHQANTYVDGTEPVIAELLTKEFSEDDPLRDKIWNGFVFGYLREQAGAAAMSVVLDSGRQIYNKNFSWAAVGSLWDVMQWDVAQWSGEGFVEDPQNIPQRLVAKTAQLRLVHANPTDFKLRDFTTKARTIRRMP